MAHTICDVRYLLIYLHYQPVNFCGCISLAYNLWRLPAMSNSISIINEAIHFGTKVIIKERTAIDTKN